MTAILKLIPVWAWLALGMLASIGYLALRLNSVKADRDAVTFERDAAQAKAKSLAATLTLQRQITEDVNKVADDAKAQADHITAAVVIADGRADSLQQQITRLLAARKTCESTVASGSKARTDLTVLLADLRRSADERAGVLAAALDRSRVAGKACEQIYNTVTANQ